MFEVLCLRMAAGVLEREQKEKKEEHEVCFGLEVTMFEIPLDA